MSLNAVLIGALAETPIHPGAGQSGGTIDLPVSREGGTGYPFVQGSSNKGIAKSRMRSGNPLTGLGLKQQMEDLFGTPQVQGRVMFGDLRLLLLPLRSSSGAYKWATCPHLLERYGRDLERACYPDRFEVPSSIPAAQVQSADAGNTRLLLEEMTFTVQQSVAPAVIDTIARLLPNAGACVTTRGRLKDQVLVMRDDDFAWFARFGLPVHAHNVLDDNTKTSRNLWYEETLPADTLLYSVAAPRGGGVDTLDPVLDKIRDRKWFQFGGNETTGQGICRLNVVDERDAGAA